MSELYEKYYDANGKLVPPDKAVLAIETETDVDLVNNKQITHPTVRCTIWSVKGGRFNNFLGEYSRWEPAQGRALECLERARKGRKLRYYP